jgi:hypothetical protein
VGLFSCGHDCTYPKEESNVDSINVRKKLLKQSDNNTLTALSCEVIVFAIVILLEPSRRALSTALIIISIVLTRHILILAYYRTRFATRPARAFPSCPANSCFLS